MPDILQLRPIQERTLDALREAFRIGNRTPMLYGPTGFGKTEMAISLMAATEQKGNRAAMVLDRIVLCDQTSMRLEKYGIDHGVLQSGHWRYRPDRKIQICSAQTLEKRGSFPGLNLLIVDEAHVQREQTIEFIKTNPQVKVIGLSASPFTKGLGSTYSTVVSATTTQELVDNGWLAPLRVFIAKQIDMTGAKKVAGEWSPKEATERGVKITGDVVTEWVKMTHELFGVPRKTIVFCAGVAHGQDLAEKFSEAGYNFVSISYKDDDEFKKDAIAEFAKPDTSIHGLIATDILTKGFDVSDVMIGVSARPFTKSFSSHVQQMGRVMRAFPGKEFAAWLDHSGNYLRFRDQWDTLYADGVQELDDGTEKPKPEPTEYEKKKAICPACGALWPGDSDTCFHCGHVRARINNVVEVPGQLLELEHTKSEKYDAATKQRWYSELLYIESTWKVRPHYAYAMFIKKFGIKPHGYQKTPRVAGPEVVGWLKSTFIANKYARAR